MKASFTITTALKGLRSNKPRSALTILGIVIGITAIILVESIGQGAQNLILGQVQGLGSRTIFIEPGREPRGPSDFAEIFTNSLKPRDVDMLKRQSNVQGLDELTPSVMQVTVVAFEGETIRTNILGASELIFNILDIYPDEGSFFIEDDVKQKAAVAVIGADVQEELFGDSDALGQKIRIKNRNFRVIGVLSKKGQVAFFNVDDTVFVPYTTAQEYLLGINYYHALITRAREEALVPRIVESIKLTLRESHGIEDASKDDFHVMTQADVVDRVKTITNALTALLLAVAGISLVVGGIGIMNIMLVTVTERTREIGLRKALGATSENILVQFLCESVMLTAIGGVIGVTLGALLAFGASLILGKILAVAWAFSFPVQAALLGITISGLVGLVFGLYPARTAARKSPIEALRYE